KERHPGERSEGRDPEVQERREQTIGLGPLKAWRRLGECGFFFTGATARCSKNAGKYSHRCFWSVRRGTRARLPSRGETNSGSRGPPFHSLRARRGRAGA